MAAGIILCLTGWMWTRGEKEEDMELRTHALHTLHTLHRAPRDIHHPNLAMSMTLSFAVQMNYSNCWICQHLPHSTTAPAWMSIPLTVEEWRNYNWQGLGGDNALWDSECHRSGNHYKAVRDYVIVNPYGLHFREVLDFIEAEVNKERLPVGFNKTMVQRVGMLNQRTVLQRNRATGELKFKVETIHVQTNCTLTQAKITHSKPHDCIRVKTSTSLNCYSEISYYPNTSKFKIGVMTCSVAECPEHVQTKVTFRSSPVCSTLPVVQEEQVKYCFTGNQSQRNSKVLVGESSCDKQTIMVTDLSRPSFLPETIYAVCGGKAYTHLPANSKGTCYLAHVIPMIRRVNSTEIQAAYSEHRRKTSRKKRTLSWWQKVIGVIIPNYGVYNTQNELAALSTVLEKHMNDSDAAIDALATEVTDIKTIALQNRMALDIMLASKGGACAVIQTECCSYVSDPTQALTKLHEDTQMGVQELHKNHGGQFWGLFEGWFGGIGNTLTRTLTLIVVTVVVLLLGFVFLSACIKAVMSRIVGSTSEVIIHPQPQRPQWVPPFHNSNIA